MEENISIPQVLPFVGNGWVRYDSASVETY